MVSRFDGKSNKDFVVKMLKRIIPILDQISLSTEKFPTLDKVLFRNFFIGLGPSTESRSPNCDSTIALNF